MVGYYASPRVSTECADCALPFSFDTYDNCSFYCAYCFAFGFRSVNPTMCKRFLTRKDIKAVNPRAVKNLFLGNGKSKDGRVFYDYFIKHKLPIQWGGLAEPAGKLEEKYRVGLELIKFFNDINYPLRFSIKGNAFADGDYLNEFSKNPDLFKFSISITTLDEELARRIEIGTPSPEDRLGMIQKLSSVGCETVLRLRPFIPFYSDSYQELIKKAKDKGAKGVSLEFLCLDTRSSKQQERIAYMNKVLGYNLINYFKEHMAEGCHSGYQRLGRKVEAPVVANIYKLTRKLGLNLGISDPNFKELGDNGNCCGYSSPNYFKPQLTELMVSTRKKVWAKDLPYCDLYWNTLVKLGRGKDNLNLDWAKKLNAGVYFPIDIDPIDRGRFNALTVYNYLKNRWNNPELGNSPYNYFQRKLIPIGLDNHRDVIYRYFPSKFEINLKEEVKNGSSNSTIKQN
jgi:DNA repair photolyase